MRRNLILGNYADPHRRILSDAMLLLLSVLLVVVIFAETKLTLQHPNRPKPARRFYLSNIIAYYNIQVHVVRRRQVGGLRYKKGRDARWKV